jgi:capsular polysaccharide biosynthesis protein
MPLEIERIVRSPSAAERIASLRCPNSYFAYPNLTCLEPIPDRVLSILGPLWKRSIHLGRDVDIYLLKDVFIVREGLVFDQNANLIDVTRTYHEADVVVSAWNCVRNAMTSGHFTSLTKGILTKSRGCSNYGHFIVEMLPRAWLARTVLGLNGWPAIIDSTSAAVQKVSAQALHRAGFGLDEVIPTGPVPEFIEELIVVDGLTCHSQYLSPFTMQCLDAIAESVPAGSNVRIYVPRRPAVTRDFESELEIAGQLHQLGFYEALTADMPFEEQVAAFKGAEAVVGITGAALANLVFCKPGTKVFNFSPSSALEVLFWMIAELRRLRYCEIRCVEIGPQLGNLPWNRAIRVTPDEIKRIVVAP